MSKAELYMYSEKAMLAQYILSINDKKTLDDVKRCLYGFVRVKTGNVADEDDARRTSENDLYSCFHGSWGEGMSAGEYCNELREGITEPREVESW